MKVYMIPKLFRGHNETNLKVSRFPTYQIHPQRPGGAGPFHSGHGWVKSFSWRKRNLSGHSFLQQTHHQRIQTVIVCRSKILVL